MAKRQAPEWFPNKVEQKLTFSPRKGARYSALKLWSEEWGTAHKDLTAEYRINSDIFMREANHLWLSEQNPELTAQEVSKLFSSIRAMLSFRTSSTSLISSHFLNEFMAEERAGTYGEFMDSHWDALHRNVLESRVSWHGRTGLVFDGHSAGNFVLSYSPRGLTSLREYLESLTQDDMKILMPAGARRGSLSGAPSVAEGKIRSILNKAKGLEERLYSRDQLSNALYRAISLAVGKGSAEPGYRLDHLGANTINAIYRVSNAAYETAVNARPGQTSTTEAMRFAEALYAHAEELGPQRVSALIHLFESPGLFGRGINKTLREVLIEVSQHEDAVEALGGMVDVALNYKGTLPTSSQWRAGAKEGLIAVESGDVLAAMLGADTKEKEQSKHQKRLRQQLGIY